MAPADKVFELAQRQVQTGRGLAGNDADWTALSTRTSNALRRAGYATPAEAAREHDGALLVRDGFGRAGLRELRVWAEDEAEIQAIGARKERDEAAYAAVNAPGHTDLMVSPEGVPDLLDGDFPATPDTDRVLRFLADGFEQAQRKRIQVGEQIRAVLQGRDETWGRDAAEVAHEVAEAEKEDGGDRLVDDILKAIASGESTGPVPIQGRMYHRAYTEERELFKEMELALKGIKPSKKNPEGVPGHPCWPWLEQVKGIGPTLACKLLARLDPEKAPTPSSFWSYCGLATVPGERYNCVTCRLERAWPVGYNVTGTHMALGTQKACKGKLVKTAGPEDGIRCAQPQPARGQKATYDQYAKKVLYLIGTGFLKVPGSKYEQVYRKEREKLDREKVGWADGRKHLTALRKVEKLFLSHLWLIWREARGLPTTMPYAFAELGHAPASYVGPWEMVG